MRGGRLADELMDITSSGRNVARRVLALAKPANGPELLLVVLAALKDARAVFADTEAVGGLDTSMERRGDSKVAGRDIWSPGGRAEIWFADAALRGGGRSDLVDGPSGLVGLTSRLASWSVLDPASSWLHEELRCSSLSDTEPANAEFSAFATECG
jgi:hypothetical protein